MMAHSSVIGRRKSKYKSVKQKRSHSTFKALKQCSLAGMQEGKYFKIRQEGQAICSSCVTKGIKSP